MATLNYSAYRIPSKIQEALSYKGSACLDHGTIGDKDGYSILTIYHKGRGRGVYAIAAKLGVSPQTVHNYLTGKRSAI